MGSEAHERVQTQNRFANLQGDQATKNVKAPSEAMIEKLSSKQEGEESKDIQEDDKNPAPTDSPDGTPLKRPEEPQKDLGSGEGATEDMQIRDLYIDRLEATCSNKDPATIPPQQVSLLEKSIIQAKNVNNLGVVTEALKVIDGKGEN